MPHSRNLGNASNGSTGVQVMSNFVSTDQASYLARRKERLGSIRTRGGVQVTSNIARNGDQLLVNARRYERVNDIFQILNMLGKNQIQKRKYASKWRKIAKKQRRRREAENRVLIFRRQHLMKKYFQKWKDVVNMRARMLRKRGCGEAFDEYEEGYRKYQRLDCCGLRYPIPQNPEISIEYVRPRSVLKKRKLTSRRERFNETDKEKQREEIVTNSRLRVIWADNMNHNALMYRSLPPNLSIFPADWMIEKAYHKHEDACVEIIRRLEECHKSGFYNRYFGKCNKIKIELNACLGSEVKFEKVRRRNAQIAKEKRRKYEELCKELGL
ncbi:2875_t:CDS:2 [Ambispora gerdemannii]|uniref:2875_t:CDS:1 n=1 Tax=Ambispora gerdemannii TaxID=144530 RepID=A0A9N8Z934_9GLOM|nr:2875_t:CDS:2 [Ambispora gerdemannii]